MNRTQALCKALGWQGGTIHQVSEETGVSVEELLYGEPLDKSLIAGYTGGWFAGRTCTVEFNLRVNFPKNKGNPDFWIGVAEGVMLQWAMTN